MVRKQYLLILGGSTFLSLVGMALVLAPSAPWWGYVLGSGSLLLAAGGFGYLGLLLLISR